MTVESAADLAAFFSSADGHGESATYTPAGGGAAETVAVIYDRTAPAERGAGGAPIVVKRRVLRAPKTAFAVRPAAGATFAVAGDSLRVKAVADWAEDPLGRIFEIVCEVA